MSIKIILTTPLTIDSLFTAITVLDGQHVPTTSEITIDKVLDGHVITVLDGAAEPANKPHPNTGKKYRCGYVNKHDERCTRGTRHRGDHDYTGVWNG